MPTQRAKWWHRLNGIGHDPFKVVIWVQFPLPSPIIAKSKPSHEVNIRVIANVICWRGSMAEQLTCNQQVVGSTPIASSKQNPTRLSMMRNPSGR